MILTYCHLQKSLLCLISMVRYTRSSLQIISNMRLPVLILILTTSFPSQSSSLVTSDPSWFNASEDQLSIPFEDVSSTTNTFDSASDQFFSADDQWNLPQDSPNLDFSLADASCSNHADESNPITAKLRSRVPNTGAICAPHGTTKSEPEWQDGDSDIQTDTINLIPDYPIIVFPDILRDGLSSTVCEKYTVVVLFPVCDSGQPKDRTTSLIYYNQYFPMYKLDNCIICTFLCLLLLLLLLFCLSNFSQLDPCSFSFANLISPLPPFTLPNLPSPSENLLIV